MIQFKPRNIAEYEERVRRVIKNSMAKMQINSVAESEQKIESGFRVFKLADGELDLGMPKRRKTPRR